MLEVHSSVADYLGPLIVIQRQSDRNGQADPAHNIDIEIDDTRATEIKERHEQDVSFEWPRMAFLGLTFPEDLLFATIDIGRQEKASDNCRCLVCSEFGSR